MTNYLIYSATNWGIKVEPNPISRLKKEKQKLQLDTLPK